MSRCSRKTFYPLDLDRIAHDVASRGIDIAPTRLTWERLARYCAAMAGEQGRDAFHTMAAVWPDYNRHDSELCYNRALRQPGKTIPMGYLTRMLRPHGIDLNRPCYRKPGAHPIIIKTTKTTITTTMKHIELKTMISTLASGRNIIGSNPLTDLLLRIYPQQAVIDACNEPVDLKFLYPLEMPLRQRVELIAKEVYGADGVDWSPLATEKAERFESDPHYADFCTMMVKTHLSLSDKPEVKGVPKGWRLPIRDILVYGGAKFLCPMAGTISMMPGTSSDPAYRRIDIDVNTGQVSGLF